MVSLRSVKISRSAVSNFVTVFDTADDNDCMRILKSENEGLDEISWSQEDRSVIELWNKECVRVGDHYQLPIP